MISSSRLELASYSALPTEFASIAEDVDGKVFVAWLNPDYEYHWVNIGAVMNRGAYCVRYAHLVSFVVSTTIADHFPLSFNSSEFCPVSKAYNLFTMMGLRHLIVLGGESGGEVVGVLSRANFLPDYIKDRTGV